MSVSAFIKTTFVFSVILLIPVASMTADSRAPLAPGEKVVWIHAPYEGGTCDLCHESADPASPGGITQEVNELCFGCHDQVAEMMLDFPITHAPAQEKCTNCHNPHNSGQRALLVKNQPALCFDCHTTIEEMSTHSRVKHDALTMDRSCSNCHNPHATNVQNLLVQLPYDLCISCHGQDDLVDEKGKTLTNFKTQVEGSHMLHGPVSAKDCSACHLTHGSDNFRLLLNDYPAKFYSGFEKDNYSLCFTCHEADNFNQETTATLTRFRNGKLNLHYLHVNKPERGRTCRACHDVHASPQDHLIRDGVPYGKSGWILKINFEKTADGGSCIKTCHDARSYSRNSEGVGLR